MIETDTNSFMRINDAHPARVAAQTAARRERRSQTTIGIALALAIIAAWLGAHVLAIFVIDWTVAPRWMGVPLVMLQTWLFVGLFIIAHDCMHGSLAPGRPGINRWFGRVLLAIYAGFRYDALLPEHHKHHRRPGTADDPDFDPDHPSTLIPWFYRFMTHYYGWRELATMSAMITVYVLVLGPPIENILVFYALPAVLSAFQLFYFGTYRPHRVEESGFADHHNSRTDDFPVLVSLATCFHFGYHHEHHSTPTTPWWRLPKVRAAALAQQELDSAT